jgi:ssDNA-binding Zn-finger/Zn-ribbon topoisomerase 1
MEWSSKQLEALYAKVYRRERSCPTCGGPLTLALSNEPDTVGLVECQTCDARHVVSLQNDRLRATFRPYTPDEARAIFAQERVGKTPICPRDGTPMEVHLQRSLARTSNAQIWCRRCRQTAEYVRPHG